MFPCPRFLAAIAVLSTFIALTAAQPARRGGPPVIDLPERSPLPLQPSDGVTTLATPTISDPPTSPLISNPPTPLSPNVCNAPFRSLDGTCTSEVDSELGGTNRPQFSYGAPRDTATPVGGIHSRLPSARLISNIVCAQADNVFSRRGLSELVTFFGQFLDHSMIATPVARGSEFNIVIPREDAIFSNFSNGELQFERSLRVRDSLNRERPINEISSAIDLTSVYGPEEERLTKLRTLKHGLMKTSAGNLLPLNTDRLGNAPSDSPAFFVAGDRRVNENPVLTAMHTLFLREHNKIAGELHVLFPEWNDEKLFQYAKLVNTAQYQKIVYEEFIPVMIGRSLPRYRGYRNDVDPTVSDVFGGAAFRIGHTMVGNQISRRGRGNSPQPSIPVENMFFRENGVLTNRIDPFIRGAIYERSQEVDVKVVNALRNFLFTNVRDEVGFDLMALNIQRGRDHALRTYNELRRQFGRGRARRYSDITRNRAVQSALHSAYGAVDRIDAIVGLFAEDHVRGASVGRTMLRIWRKEFSRLRDGDRFFYLREDMYPRELWTGFPRLRGLFTEQSTFKKLILRNTIISRSELSGSVWRTNS